MLLQHIWVNHLQFRPQLQNYQEMIEKIKLTPRVWNPTVKLNQFLKYVSWILNLSINLIGFKHNPRHVSDTFQCEHRSRPCFHPYYKFQNPYIRFCKIPLNDFFQVNILEYKSNYYTLSSSASCTPLLINQLPNFSFSYKSEPVTLHDIHAILHQTPIEKPFSIALYSTCTYVRSCHIKIISQNIIGHLKNDSEDILHLFLMPHLHGPTFDVYVLDSFSSNNITFNQKNVYCNTHITEGKYLFNKHSHSNKDMLDQEHCICEHPDTERFNAPNNRTFRPLGEY